MCKIRKTIKESTDMLQQAYGDSLMNMPMFYHWYNVFQNGRVRVVEPREGRPSTARNEVLLNTVSLSYKKTKESLFVNLHNICTIQLVAYSQF